MKKIVIASLLLICGFAKAQNFQGMAVYESKTSTAEFTKGFSGNKDITPEMQKQIEERMRKMFEKTFVLNFDKSASIYKEEEIRCTRSARWRQNDDFNDGRWRNPL